MASTAYTCRRLAALTALVLFAGCAVAEQVHAALVRHVRCAAHGELVHGSEVAEVPAGDGVQLARGGLSEEGHGHEHCKAALRSAPMVAAGAVTLEEAAESWKTVSAPERPLTAATRVWALAPKGSPPRA